MKKKAVKATHDPASAPFGFQNWNLKSAEEMDETVETLFAQLQTTCETHIEKMIEEALKLATAEYACFVRFEIDFDNPRSPDPTTIRVGLPLASDDTADAEWTFSLTELVHDMIDRHQESAKSIDPDMKPTFEQIRDGLRGLADKIDAALARPRIPGDQQKENK